MKLIALKQLTEVEELRLRVQELEIENAILKSETTLAQAREQVQNNLDKKDSFCPCCERRTRAWPNTVDSRSAEGLIRAFHASRLTVDGWVSPMELLGHPANFHKMKHWGLIETSDERKNDGNSAGFWRLTEKGELFVLGHVSIQKVAHVFKNRVTRFSGPEWTIRQALGKKFNYRELMTGIR